MKHDALTPEEKERLFGDLAAETETRQIEWKASQNLKDKGYLAKIARAIMALANTQDGGYLVIGIDQTFNGPEHYQGIPKEDIQQWESPKLIDNMRNYMQPSVPFVCIPEKHDGKTFVVVKVPQFEDQPVICIKTQTTSGNGSKVEIHTQAGVCYVRPRSKPESVSVSTYEDMNDLLDLAAKKRAAKLIRQARDIGCYCGVTGHSQAADRDQFQAQRKDF